jgi:hypothetical protein
MISIQEFSIGCLVDYLKAPDVSADFCGSTFNVYEYMQSKRSTTIEASGGSRTPTRNKILVAY